LWRDGESVAAPNRSKHPRRPAGGTGVAQPQVSRAEKRAAVQQAAAEARAGPAPVGGAFWVPRVDALPEPPKRQPVKAKRTLTEGEGQALPRAPVPPPAPEKKTTAGSGFRLQKVRGGEKAEGTPRGAEGVEV
jgi:hypothetical protein